MTHADPAALWLAAITSAAAPPSAPAVAADILGVLTVELLRGPGGAVLLGAVRLAGATQRGDVERLSEREQRWLRRLSACRAAGLVLPHRPGDRLPAGIAKLAQAEGVSRQGFAADLQRALLWERARMGEATS